MENVKTIQLRCQDCNGTMNIDKDKQVLLCPYCGSKKILIESDAVKIERLKSQVELGQQQVELSKQEHEIKLKEYEIGEKNQNFKREMLSIVVAIVVFLFIVFAYEILIP